MSDHEQAASTPAEPAHPVLVGYDGSNGSGRALAWATGMARRTGRPLLVAYISPEDSSQDPAGLDWLRAELADTLAASGLEFDVTGCSGDVAHRLARLADEHRADALVVGAPEQPLHHLIGSVPAWMARHAHCPVVIVP